MVFFSRPYWYQWNRLGPENPILLSASTFQTSFSCSHGWPIGPSESLSMTADWATQMANYPAHKHPIVSEFLIPSFLFLVIFLLARLGLSAATRRKGCLEKPSAL